MLSSGSALVLKTLMVFPSGQKVAKQIDNIWRQNMNDSTSARDPAPALKVARGAASEGKVKYISSAAPFVALGTPARKALEAFGA